MLIISLVLAVIGLAALVFAVVTSNELVAWVCIGASVIGVLLLIIDALQERKRREAALPAGSHDLEAHDDEAADYPADAVDEADGSSDYPDSEGAADASVGDDHNTP